MSLENNYVEIETELSGKFVDKKMMNNALILSYQRLGYEKKANNVLSCGTELEFHVPEDFSEPPKLYHANFCKDRLCAACNWRRSMKIYGQISQIMDEIQDQYAFIFLTLTVRNCSGTKLANEINRLQESYNRFMKLPEIKKMCQGYFKALELTHNPDSIANLKYHPHFHTIIAVNKSYFTSRDYIRQSKFGSLWAKACNIDYGPIIDVRKVKPEKTDKDEISIKGAICETAKYSVKTADILRGSFDEIDRTVQAYSTALQGRRLCSFGGIFKKIARDLKLDDLTDGDLVNTDNQKIRADLAYYIIKYQWGVGGGGYQRIFTGIERKDENDTGNAI